MSGERGRYGVSAGARRGATSAFFAVVFSSPTPGCWRCQHRCWGRGWRARESGYRSASFLALAGPARELLVFVTVLAALSCQPSLSAHWLAAKQEAVSESELEHSSRLRVDGNLFVQKKKKKKPRKAPGKWPHFRLMTCNSAAVESLPYIFR